jgi:hypothetical protein
MKTVSWNVDGSMGEMVEMRISKGEVFHEKNRVKRTLKGKTGFVSVAIHGLGNLKFGKFKITLSIWLFQEKWTIVSGS